MKLLGFENSFGCSMQSTVSLMNTGSTRMLK